MLIQLLFANTGHFALTIFGSFVFFAAGLLYFDSWQVNKRKKNLLFRGAGFFLLALVTLVHATTFEIPLLIFFMQLLKISGLILILFSLIDEPILHLPQKNKLALFIPTTISVFSLSLIPLSAALMLLISATYFRKAKEGFEKQLKPAFIAFLFLGISEILQIFFFWSDTLNVFWSKILAPYGPVWNISHVFEFVGILILFIWVWGYIRFRLQIQLFVLSVALSMFLFLTTTTFYTFLLLHNLETDTLSHLRTDVRVIQYAIERQEAEALAISLAVAENPDIKKAFLNKNQNDLYNLTSNLMLSYNTNVLAVLNDKGRVIMRGEDRESIGDTLIFDPTVISALKGQRLATVISLEGAIAPRIQIKATAPLYENSNLQGAISTGFWIDSSFVDGVKAVTGLDVAVFGGNKRAATTFVAPDGKTRFIASLETNPLILDTVLNQGKIFVGAEDILNRPYYTAYAPLKTYHDKTIGMLFVGKLQTELFDIAQRSIQLTLLGSAMLIALSLIPAYLFSRFLEEHLEA